MERVSVNVVSEPSASEIDREASEIAALLQADDYRFRFSAPAQERRFRIAMRKRAVYTVRNYAWLVIGLYLLIGMLSFAELQRLKGSPNYTHDRAVWQIIFVLEAFVVFGLQACGMLSRMDRWYWNYVCLIAVLGTVGVTVGTAAFVDPYINQQCSYIVVLVLMLVYGVGGLRAPQAVAASTAAGVLSLLIEAVLGLPQDWGQFANYFLMSNVVGAAICYVLERRDRIMYLQGRLLELEKHQLNRLSQRLDQLSREDALTGLANRRHFNEVLHREWERARRSLQPISLVFLDIDHFKGFNDAYGHLDGDKALAAVAGALRSAVRRPADLPARYGGEEFVILLPDTDRQGALEVAAQVMTAVDQLHIPHGASDVAPYVTASVGVATEVPVTGRNSAYLVAAADAAVYSAKASGRHKIVVQEASQGI